MIKIKSVYCPDCDKLLKKAKIEMEPGQWIYVWICECIVDKKTHVYKNQGSGPKRKVEKVVC